MTKEEIFNVYEAISIQLPTDTSAMIRKSLPLNEMKKYEYFH
jgi:hypothetical protein